MPEMSAGFLAEIDWRQPWLRELHSIARPILQAKNWVDAVNATAAAQMLCNHRGLPIQFVPQNELPSGIGYEAFISASGKVPTRNNLHDFFNSLVWLTFPKAKVQLNALQSAEITRAATVIGMDGTGVRSRGKLRDAATIFDENAALLITRDPAIAAALGEHRWLDVFVNHRSAFQRDCEVQLFGHALMEKLVTPYKAVTAHAWVVIVDDAYFALPHQYRRRWIDMQLVRQLEGGFSTSDFTPVPVLGVPTWTEGQDAAFYADTAVFRPKRGSSFS